MCGMNDSIKEIYRLLVMWAAAATNTLLGGTDGIFCTLLIFISLDYITGICAAISNKQLSSRIGARGLAKKMGILSAVALATLIENNINSIEELYNMSAEDIVEKTGIEKSIVDNLMVIMKDVVEIVEAGEDEYETTSEEVVEEIEVYECPNCGSSITEDMTKCPKCGIELTFE